MNIADLVGFEDLERRKVPDELRPIFVELIHQLELFRHNIYSQLKGIDLENFPERATMWHDESTVLKGNDFAITFDANQEYAVYNYQNPPANTDSFTNSFFLKAGTYSFFVLGITDANRGIVDWYVDDIRIVSQQDWYSAALTYNVLMAMNGISIPTDGYHILKGIVNGNNAASTNYFMTLTKLWFKKRTGD